MEKFDKIKFNIKKNDVKQLEKLYKSLNEFEKTEFNYNYSEYIGLTIPNSIDCLRFLMNNTISRLNIWQIIDKLEESLKNGDDWIFEYFNIAKEQESKFEDKHLKSIIKSNYKAIIDIDYDLLFLHNNKYLDLIINKQECEVYNTLLLDEIYKHNHPYQENFLELMKSKNHIVNMKKYIYITLKYEKYEYINFDNKEIQEILFKANKELLSNLVDINKEEVYKYYFKEIYKKIDEDIKFEYMSSNYYHHLIKEILDNNNTGISNLIKKELNLEINYEKIKEMIKNYDDLIEQAIINSKDYGFEIIKNFNKILRNNELNEIINPENKVELNVYFDYYNINKDIKDKKNNKIKIGKI